ncbi:MAG: sulfatase-like hydrolase/transferase [Planctomycetota bacterium]
MGLQARRDFLKGIGAGVAALATSPGLVFAGRSSANRPNVILVITDDQGYGDLACHGNPVIYTPNLDKLHASSVRLTDFHVSPTCSPTRASVMTGRYCNRTGVWHTIMGRSLLRRDEVTMADVFAANGYRTGIFGKWHLGDNYPFRPQDRGFDEVLVHGGGGVGNSQDYWSNDYFDDTYFRNGRPEKFKGYCTDVWFDEAMKFIEANKDRTFFCYLSTNAPHGPFLVPKQYSQVYKDKGIRSPRAEFYGMITSIDENIGRLVQKLNKLGLSDNTVLIFMTDNGSALGGRRDEFNAGMRSVKGSEYDGGHRVPCFIRWPGGGLEGGHDIGRLTAHIDLLPTLIELCGLKAPADVRFDGVSLRPLLYGEGLIWPERIVVTDSQRVDHPIKWRRSATMTDRWRLINGEKLYDIKADASQKNDIADKHPQVVKKLRKGYEDWWSDVSKRFGDYCNVIIGSDKANPVCLTSHDLHGQVVWNQEQVREGERADGFWAVEVAHDGMYEIALRRWPREVNRPITEIVDIHESDPTFEPITVTDARLKVGDVDVSRPVQPEAEEVKFQVQLMADKTRLQAWFINGLGDGATFGAYYVYVKRL